MCCFWVISFWSSTITYLVKTLASLHPHEFPWFFPFHSSVFTMGELSFLDICRCFLDSLSLLVEIPGGRGDLLVHILYFNSTPYTSSSLFILKFYPICVGNDSRSRLLLVYPRMTDRRPLKTHPFLKALFVDEPVVVCSCAFWWT